MIDSGELKRGTTIELDGKLYQILEHQHIKLGRGTAQTRLKLRDIQGGHTIERSFQAGEKFALARLDRRSGQFLYEEQGIYYVMDQESYEQILLSAEVVGESANYLRDGVSLWVLLYRNQPVSVELPAAVELRVVETAPGFKGDTATSGSKPAKLETGLSVQVPFFINAGDILKVDTRSGEYLERVG